MFTFTQAKVNVPFATSEEFVTIGFCSKQFSFTEYTQDSETMIALPGFKTFEIQYKNFPEAGLRKFILNSAVNISCDLFFEIVNNW